MSRGGSPSQLKLSSASILLIPLPAGEAVGVRFSSLGCRPVAQGTSCCSTKVCVRCLQCSLFCALCIHLPPPVLLSALSTSRLLLNLRLCLTPLFPMLCCSRHHVRSFQVIIERTSSPPRTRWPQKVQMRSNMWLLHRVALCLCSCTLACRRLLAFQSAQFFPDLRLM